MAAGDAWIYAAAWAFSKEEMEQRLLGTVVSVRDRARDEEELPFIRAAGGGYTGVCYIIFMPLCMPRIFHNEFLKDRGAWGPRQRR